MLVIATTHGPVAVATALQPASVSEAAASEAFSSAQQSIFPTNLLAAELFGQGKKFTGYKQRNTGAPADLAPADRLRGRLSGMLSSEISQ